MKTKHILSYFSLLLIVIACQKGEGETVETANILRPQADIPYTFSRNGQSSVDEHSVSLLREPLEIIERRLLNGAISNFTYGRSNDKHKLSQKDRKKKSKKPFYKEVAKKGA